MVFTGMSSKMMRFGVMNAVFIIICYLAVIAVLVDALVVLDIDEAMVSNIYM